MIPFIINGLFLTQRPTGVHRFAYEMCIALLKENCKFIVIAPRHILKQYYSIIFPLRQIGISSGHLWEQLDLPLFLSFCYPQSTLITFTGLGPLFKKKHITTIHDISFMVNSKWFSRSYSLFYRWATPIVAKNAMNIITVSQFSKNEITHYLSIKTNKIKVIYNAIPNEFYNKNSTNRPPQTRPYILAVSSRDPRKNFKRLIDAYLLSGITTHDLVIIGGKVHVFANENLIKHNNIHLIDYVGDDELRSYYQHASLFIYPSLYEGFGIPPLEALAQGCPVLASNIEVFHEIYGNAITYCDPTDINDIIDKMHYCLTTPYYDIPLVEKCIEQYNWEKSAKNFIRIESLLK